jgi:hypothetical protein
MKVCLRRMVYLMFFLANGSAYSQVVSNALSGIVRQLQPSEKWSFAGDQAANARFPLIERVEMRTELDRLLFSRQEYLTRATLHGFGQGKAEKRKMRAFIDWKSEARRDDWHAVIYNMYSSLIDWHYAVSVYQGLEEERALLQQADSLFTRYLEEGREIDLVDYTSLKQELLDVQADLAISKVRWQNAARAVGADTLQATPDPFWMGPDQMALLLDTLEMKVDALLAAEIAYLDASAAVLHAETGRWLDFVQARYTIRDDLLLQNRFSIGFGFVFPWKGSSIVKGKEIAFRKEQLTEESRSSRFLREEELALVKSKFSASYLACNQYKNLLKDASLDELKDRIQKSGKVEPIKWLLLKRNALKRKAVWHKELHLMWEYYIKALHLSGHMYVEPWMNYLYGRHLVGLPAR